MKPSEFFEPHERGICTAEPTDAMVDALLDERCDQTPTARGLKSRLLCAEWYRERKGWRLALTPLGFFLKRQVKARRRAERLLAVATRERDQLQAENTAMLRRIVELTEGKAA